MTFEGRWPHATYTTDDGTPVVTQSMVKTYRQCQREYYYKYVLRLQPKIQNRPLTFGKWMHSLLEAYYKGEDWKAVHKKLTFKYSQLMDEEKEKLGDLPREAINLFNSYIWHYSDPQYKGHDWNVLEVEKTLEAELPNGMLFRGRVDMIVENDYGIWIVDHKNQKRMPDWSYRLLDEQSPLYIWAARMNGIPVEGFIWNYLVSQPIPTPRVVKAGDRFYANSGECDYPTLVRAIKQAKEDYPGVFPNSDERERLKLELQRLKNARWSPDVPPTSPWFRRDVMEKSDDLIDRVLSGVVTTADEMHGKDWSCVDAIPRNIDACKGFMCSYRSLTEGDLIMGDSTMAQRREYVKADPLSYYQETSS